MTELSASLERRAARHRALGDERRLAIVDALRLSDRTPSDLAAATGVGSNLLAFHLGILEDVGIIQRTPSQGDARRRYVRLADDPLAALGAAPAVAAARVLFVCTANSARSQLAAALWHERTDRPTGSAGTHPAAAVHPLAVATAQRHHLAVSDVPRGYDDVPFDPDLVVSVCDRALESGPPPFAAPVLHWSVPDPAAGDRDDFERTYRRLAERIDRLAAASRGAA
jgi:protein-tyrosine-phosphatase